MPINERLSYRASCEVSSVGMTDGSDGPKYVGYHAGLRFEPNMRVRHQEHGIGRLLRLVPLGGSTLDSNSQIEVTFRDTGAKVVAAGSLTYRVSPEGSTATTSADSEVNWVGYYEGMPIQVGDRIWHTQHGPGAIHGILIMSPMPSGMKRPLQVTFDKRPRIVEAGELLFLANAHMIVEARRAGALIIGGGPTAPRADDASARATQSSPAIRRPSAPAMPPPPPPKRPKDKIATLRKTLNGELMDFISKENFFDTNVVNCIVWLLVQLSRYQEEGVVLYPRFVMCDAISLLLPQVQGADLMKIGSGPQDISTMHRALKQCAPLARDEWIAYVQRTSIGFDYGIFRKAGPPNGIDLREQFVSSMVVPPEKGGVILISQVANRVVELVGARVHAVTYHLSAADEEQPSPLLAIGTLARAITGDVENSAVKEETRAFVESALADALRRGHGTLIAVAKPGGVPPELSRENDSVCLDDSPVDIADAMVEHALERSAESHGRALAQAKLIEGMLATDGITVFESNGRVTRYNVFVKSADASGTAMNGGARRRAFEALKALVDDGKLLLAFFRSADGDSEIHAGAKHV